jgi:hypothetical protein
MGLSFPLLGLRRLLQQVKDQINLNLSHALGKMASGLLATGVERCQLLW